MSIKGLRIKNLLSFGPDTKFLPLGPLNVLIGPNGSGKSNFLEAISLLQAAPKDLSAPVKQVGGIRDWLWKGANNPIASLDIQINNYGNEETPLRHIMCFADHGGRFELVEERIEHEKPNPPLNSLTSFYYFLDGHSVLVDHVSVAPQNRELKRAIPQTGTIHTLAG